MWSWSVYSLADMEFWHDVETSSSAGLWLQAVVVITDLLLQLTSNERMADAARAHLAQLEKVSVCLEMVDPSYVCMSQCLKVSLHNGTCRVDL